MQVVVGLCRTSIPIRGDTVLQKANILYVDADPSRWEAAELLRLQGHKVTILSRMDEAEDTIFSNPSLFNVVVVGQQLNDSKTGEEYVRHLCSHSFRRRPVIFLTEHSREKFEVEFFGLEVTILQTPPASISEIIPLIEQLLAYSDEI